MVRAPQAAHLNPPKPLEGARPRAEADLPEPAAPRQSPLSSTYDWEYWVRPEGTLDYVSPSCERVSGYSAGELKAAPRLLDDMVLPEDYALWVDHREACRGQATTGELTFRIRRPDGEVRWVEHLCQPVFDGQGRSLGRRVSVRDVTPRRAAEEALRQSEARYRAIVETHSDGFWIVDAEGRIVEANDACVRRSGYSRDELLSMRFSDVDAGETEEEAETRMERLRARGWELFESVHRAKDGTLYPVEVSASYWPIEGGRVFAFIRDISSRKRAEYLLRARVELSEVAARSDTDAVLQHALDAAEILTGSTIGFFHFVDEDQVHLTLQAWSTNTLGSMCTAEGKGSHYPIGDAGVWVECALTRQPVIHNDYASLPHRKGLPPGHAPVVRELVVPILRDGKLTAILGVGNKSTPYTPDDVEPVRELASMAMEAVARKRTELALRESEARLGSIFRSSLVAIGVVHFESGRLVEVNDTFCTLFGYSRDEMVGRTSLELGLWAKPEQRVVQIRDLTETGRAVGHDVLARRKSGETLTLYIAAELVQLGGEPHFIALLSDVTEARRAEEERERLFGQARLDAETKSRLLMEVNHRVKNNLLSLQGMLLVEKRLSPPEARPWTDEPFERLAGRLRGLLAAHELLSQREWAPVPVTELARKVIVGAIGRVHAEGGLALEIGPSEILVSPRQAGALAIVLYELATNTAKHAWSPSKGVRVGVTAAREDNFATLDYRDDGPGYSDEALSGERGGVGLRLLQEIAAGSLGGSLELRNDGGALAVLRMKIEDPGQT